MEITYVGDLHPLRFDSVHIDIYLPAFQRSLLPPYPDLSRLIQTYLDGLHISFFSGYSSSWDFSVRLCVCLRTHVLNPVCNYTILYTRVNKNPSAWNFLSPKPEVRCGTVAIIIRVVLPSPYLRIHAVSLSSIHYNQSHRVYINRRRQYICLIWN